MAYCMFQSRPKSPPPPFPLLTHHIRHSCVRARLFRIQSFLQKPAALEKVVEEEGGVDVEVENQFLRYIISYNISLSETYKGRHIYNHRFFFCFFFSSLFSISAQDCKNLYV